MSRFSRTVLIVALGALVAMPALAADPSVTKRVVTESDGTSVILLRVVASDRAVFGITVEDASASIEDIVAPRGWVAVSSGDRVMFRTTETPIKSGKSASFRIVTTNSQGALGVTFRDEKSPFGSKKSI